MLDEALVEKKARDIARYLSEMEPVLGLSRREFTASYRDMRIAERDFQLVVDAAVDINTHMLLARGLPPPEKNYDSFTALGDAGVMPAEFARRLAPSAGLRSKLVHEYDEINPDILYPSLKKFFVLYKDYGRAVLAYLNKTSRP